MQPDSSNLLLAVFCAVILAILVILFYQSEDPDTGGGKVLRERVENKLYDLRTRLAPSTTSTRHVSIIGIDDATIKAMDGDSKDISSESIVRIAQAALSGGARVVGILLHSQVTPYTDKNLAPIVQMAQDPRVVLGVFDQLDSNPESEFDKLSDSLMRVRSKIGAADIQRWYRRNVIRDVQVFKPEGIPFFPSLLIRRYDPSVYERIFPLGSRTLKLNYIDKDRIRKINALSLVNAPRASTQFKDQIVLIGYTTFRLWTFRNREATHVNTPWQSDGDDVQFGLPVVYLHAISAINLLTDSGLRSMPVAINVLQTFCLSIVALSIWSLSVGFASFLFIGGWCLILVLHAFLFGIFSIYIPLADSILFSSIATIIGAIWKLRIEGRRRAALEAKTASERELASIQDRFLNQFSFEIAKINQQIRTALNKHEHLKSGEGTLPRAYAKSVESSAELDEFLKGIQQFASMQSRTGHPPDLHIQKVDIQNIVNRTLAQFDTRRHEKRLKIEVDCRKDMTLLTDKTLLSQILFNLVSNAIKYSPDEGRIYLKVEQEAKGFRISVTDQGPGIALENQTRIFEKFYRIKDDSVYKIKGHGLGLYLSQYFADLIGAKISLSSTIGRGSTFSLDLPTGGT